MTNDMVRKMQKLFWLIGWVTLVLVVIAGVYSVSQFLRLSSFVGGQFPTQEFSLLLHLGKFASGMASGFFCLLVSSVFGMIANRSPAKKFDQRLLYMTCVWFAVQGVVGVAAWGFSMSSIFVGHSIMAEIDSIGLWLSALSMLVSLFGQLMPFLYGITIYVLYRHFAKLVSFESQVV